MTRPCRSSIAFSLRRTRGSHRFAATCCAASRLLRFTELPYDGIQTSGGVGVLGLGNASAKYEDVAVRRINEQVEKYVATQARLCKEYNACVIDDRTYHEEAQRLRALLVDTGATASRLSTAGSEGERRRILSDVYAKTVPASARPEEVELEMSIVAELPPELAAQKPGQFVVRPNEPLPTARASRSPSSPRRRRTSTSSRAARRRASRCSSPTHASGPRIRCRRLNDKDLGTEWIGRAQDARHRWLHTAAGARRLPLTMEVRRHPPKNEKKKKSAKPGAGHFGTLA